MIARLSVLVGAKRLQFKIDWLNCSGRHVADIVPTPSELVAIPLPVGAWHARTAAVGLRMA